MTKLYSVILLLIMVGTAVAADDKQDLKQLFCADMLKKINIITVDIKITEESLNYGRGRMQDKEQQQRIEWLKYATEYKTKIQQDTSYLASLIIIYKAAECDVTEMMQHIYCPKNYNQECEWVYKKPATKPNARQKK